jgi:adenine-specific DNA-methyltransferase
LNSSNNPNQINAQDKNPAFCSLLTDLIRTLDNFLFSVQDVTSFSSGDRNSSPQAPNLILSRLAPRELIMGNQNTNMADAVLHKRRIDQYEYRGKKRPNNPPVGLVTADNDKDRPSRKYTYDPHLDPSLVWSSKTERAAIEVPTVSLHVHERIDPRTIIKAVRKKNGNGSQGSLFENPEENPPLREAIDFYRHPHNWTNRLIAGDSLLVMNSLLEKEGMAGQIQMVYVDPPYGVKYGSNFQPFVNRRQVKDGLDEDLTQEPETIRAFRDTWELGIHSYLSYLRDRLHLARELLHESGSCFVQISDENVHLVRNLMDEVFGFRNFSSMIYFATTGGFATTGLSRIGDYLIWYAKDREKMKYRQLYQTKNDETLRSGDYRYIEIAGRKRRAMTDAERSDPEKLPKGSRIFRLDNILSQGGSKEDTPFEFEGKIFRPGTASHWKANYPEGMENLKKAGRIAVRANSLSYIRYFDDFPLLPLRNMWTDTSIAGRPEGKRYVVETNPKVVTRCILMTSDPGELVLDPTCGSGTTAFVAEQWGRRWITCDTSRVAITLTKQRLMTALFEYYQLAHPLEGVISGFNYEKVPHVTLRSIANGELPAEETLFDRPVVDHDVVRVTGPFTVEAVPAPLVKSVSDVTSEPRPADISIVRQGATLKHTEWRDELLKTGIRGKSKQSIQFSRIEPLLGTRWIHADGETKDKHLRVVISFGPEDAPLERRQIELAWEEARTLRPKPAMIAFAAFHFDPEAAKDIDELSPEKTGVMFLKIQMNTDLMTEDLKKKRSNNQSFWLIGQPDFELRRINRGEHRGKWEVELFGFDYYNTKTGAIESGDTSKIAVWFLDPDYDGRSLFPRQVFFPLSGNNDGWSRLARNLKAEIDAQSIEKYQGTRSLPFELGDYQRVAVKIVDDRGIESLRIHHCPTPSPKKQPKSVLFDSKSLEQSKVVT